MFDQQVTSRTMSSGDFISVECRQRRSTDTASNKQRTNNPLVNHVLLFCVYGFVCLFSLLVSSTLKQIFPFVRVPRKEEVIHDFEDELHFTSRGLLIHNCTPRSIDEFPPDFFTEEERRGGGVTVHIVIALYMFAGLAYVCEVYFVPSLEVLCSLLKLQHDVAGATLMAVGSSAPEFAASVIGAFITETDIGIGTVVGSLVFNLFIIIACCCFFAGHIVPLTWWPLVRDCTVYLIGIFGLIWVMHDNLATWYESMILSFGYVFYIIILYFNPRLSKMAIAWSDERKQKKLAKQKKEDKAPLIKRNGTPSYGTIPDGDVSNHYTEPTEQEETNLSITIVDGESNKGKENGDPVKPNGYVHPGEDHDPFEKYENSRFVLTPPSGIIRTSLYIAGLPMIFLMFLTIPDCRFRRWRWWFIVTFIMSTVWIAGLAYILVWMVALIGDTFGIPDTVMGITFLAAGTSIPDAMASSLVARDYLGDMAISNIIGSNIFEIYVCLALLWFIRSLITDMSSIPIYSSGLTFTSIILIFTVLFAFSAIHLNGWKLDKKMGVICTIMYAIVITFSILYELNVFMDVNPPPC